MRTPHAFDRAVAFAVAVVAVAATLQTPLLAEATAASDVGALPSPRLGAAAVHVGDGIVFVFGGRSGGEYLDEIVRYDAATGVSEVVARLPATADPDVLAGRQVASAVYSGDKVYVFGGAALRNVGDLNNDGKDDFVAVSIPDIVEFDPVTLNATRLPQDALPEGRWGTGAAWHGGIAHVFGGFTYDYANTTTVGRLATIVAFEPSAPAGSRIAVLPQPLPHGLQDAAVATIGDRTFIMGGYQQHSTAAPCPPPLIVCPSDAVIAFDAGTGDSWVTNATLPERIYYAAGAPVEGARALVLGGRADGAARDTVLMFDAATETVATLATRLPTPRFGAAAATSPDGGALLFGGRDDDAFTSGMVDVVKVDPIPVDGRPPVAAIAPLPPAECIGGRATVTLDASASTDPDGDALTYEWRASGADIDDPTAAVTRARVPLGITAVSLWVTDGIFGASARERVTVQDTVPPNVYVTRPTDGALYVNDEAQPVDTGWSHATAVGPLTVRVIAGDSCRLEAVHFVGSDGSQAYVTAAPHEFTINPSARWDGVVTEVAAQARDASGNTATAAVSFLQVGTRP